MRFDRLDLIAFGNFSGTALDFSVPGLHIIYGPNEAGKTTARAAVSNLLYDFDFRTPYDFFHPMSKLQLGGRLRADDGSSVEVVRYKRSKDPLIDMASDRPINAAVWAAMLQGVSKGDFESMFTVGWQQLLSETAELVTRGGALGETLFAAGLGVRELDAVLKRLDDEAATLFGARASTRRVNSALKAYSDARKRINDLSLRPAHYAEILKNHEKAKKLHGFLQSQRRSLEVEYERLVTLRGVLPTIGVRTHMIGERTGLLENGYLPPASWAKRVEQALDDQSELIRKRSTLGTQVQSTAEKLSEIAVDDVLLSLADRVDVLAEKIAAYEVGRADRSGLDQKCHDAEHDALVMLSTIIGQPAGAVELKKARAILAARDAFGPARDEWTKKDNALVSARAALTALQEEMEDIEGALALLPDAIDPSALRDAGDAAMIEGNLDQAISSAQSDLINAQSKRLEMAGRLGLSEDEITDALRRPSPSDGEVEDILANLDDAATTSRAALDLAANADRREIALLNELEAVALGKELPSEEDLANQRKSRDDTWDLVRSSWLEKAFVIGEGTPYADEQVLASSYELAINDADRTVDLLWQEADRTAHRSSLLNELERVRSEAVKARVEAAYIGEGSLASYEKWRESWPDLPIPESSGALRQWVQSLDRLRTFQQDWTEARSAHRIVFRSLRFHRNRLTELLRSYGVDVVSGSDLGPVLTRTRAFLGDLEFNRNERLEMDKRVHTIERNLPKARTTVDGAMEAERAAAETFRDLLGPYATGVASPGAGGAALAQLNQLERLLDSRDSLLDRINGIDERSVAFENELRDLLTGMTDIAPHPPSDAARELVRRVKAARDIEATYHTILTVHESAKNSLENADTELTGLRQELTQLAAEGQVNDSEELATTAENAIRIATLDGEIAKCDSQLINQGGGRSIGDLDSDAQGRDLAELNPAIDTCKESLEVVRTQLEEATSERDTLARDLAAMDGSDAAASEASRAEAELARAVEAAERYLRVVLARHIADEAIHRYSEAHQDPLLTRASRHFEMLTNGRYRQVAVDDDPKKGSRLSAIYSSGEERAIPELSDGTRDQLYFALRLAAIEEALLRSGSMPIVLDDVLVNFDDSRAGAALRCLAALAESNQILLFTHHIHLLRLAEEVLSSGQFVVHKLILA